jgi:hypothetical protein
LIRSFGRKRPDAIALAMARCTPAASSSDGIVDDRTGSALNP